MRISRAELPSLLAAPEPAKPREGGHDRHDFTAIPYRDPAKLSPCVCFQLVVGTFLVLWLAVIEAIGLVR
jgi:hypothetical protein